MADTTSAYVAADFRADSIIAPVREAWLWQSAFEEARGSDITTREQVFFKVHLEAMRDKAKALVARIATDMPGYTVHDETHLDALWETASLVAKPGLTLTPPEAFVFGGAVLLHDAAMTLAAYPGGLVELKATTAWADAAALRGFLPSIPGCTAPTLSSELETKIKTDVLRRLHAEKAEEIATQGWLVRPDGQERIYLIEDIDLRRFYGRTIGLLAHSHWWPISRVERDLARKLGPMPPHTRHEVDLLKLAALLRVADALQLDRRRAPHFRRALERPEGVSALHWTSQEKLAFPYIEGDAVVFTSGEPCGFKDAEAWWVAYDAFTIADRELNDADLLLRNHGRTGLAVRRVKGVGNPREMSQHVLVSGWRPVETGVHASDISKLIETLGGEQLYGDDATAPVRELLQNAMDAIQARRRLQGRPPEWGKIIVELTNRPDGVWLSVEDTGVGMSEAVLVGALLDFGSSLWRSSQIAEEFPGLAAKGMDAIGRFGVGFFSVFMLGEQVRVTTRRYDQAEIDALLLEFRNGIGSRPILSSAPLGTAPLDGGTRIEIRLRIDPRVSRGICLRQQIEDNNYPFNRQHEMFPSLESLVAWLAPASRVSVAVNEFGQEKLAISADDWRTIPTAELAARVSRAGVAKDKERNIAESFMREIALADGASFGRAALWPIKYIEGQSALTLGGLRITSVAYLFGIVSGRVTTAARDIGSMIVPPEALSAWAAEQATLIEASELSMEHKALSAELCLECGAPVTGLPVAQLGDVWLTSDQLRAELSEMNEVAVCVGDIDYEDYENVPKWRFEQYFERSTHILFIPALHMPIGASSGRNWFGNRIGRRSFLSSHFRSILCETWGDFEEVDDEREIGRVDGEEIIRRIDVFRKGQISGAA